MTRLQFLIILLLTFTCTKAQKKANWYDTAVIYQITPYIFTDSCQYPDIEAKLPELASLGINTIYLQPVFKTHRGKQSYDITDYFQLRDDLGNEQQLHSLIKAAKDLKLHVLFDMVPNHTSINHPYAQDVIARGSSSEMKYEVEFGGRGSMNNDMVVFRLADIMYMKAESIMRLNGGTATQEAVDLVNAVRARSFDAGDPDAEYTIGSLTLDELLNERGRELAYEMHRRDDLIRFDKFTDEWWEKPASSEKYEVFPIPFDVLTANPSLKQNDGY